MFTGPGIVAAAQADADICSPGGLRSREAPALVQKTLEDVRSAGGIGSSLQAEVELRAPPAMHAALARTG
jgi:isoleucyl-tRNA synthetase